MAKKSVGDMKDAELKGKKVSLLSSMLGVGSSTRIFDAVVLSLHMITAQR